MGASGARPQSTVSGCAAALRSWFGRGVARALQVPAMILVVGLSLLATSTAVESSGGVVQRGDYLSRPDVRAFIDALAEQENYSVPTLESLMAQATRQSRVLELIQRPAEGKPWHEYRDIFITDRRIEAGVKFWDDNAPTLERAARRFGVPEEIIVGIIGVETFFGTRMGQTPVFDALVTLGFDYPPRAEFFRKELRHFLLMIREESIDPLGVQGSYAGAMGMGQFMPSSYRTYAVDFDGDGKRDLFNSVADGIGSVANYFKAHDWRPGEEIVSPARVSGSAYKQLQANDRRPRYLLADLSRAGVSPTGPVSEDERLVFMDLEGRSGDEFWVGHHNFFVITQYNHSVKYALVVYQLGEEIKKRRGQKAVWSSVQP